MIYQLHSSSGLQIKAVSRCCEARAVTLLQLLQPPHQSHYMCQQNVMVPARCPKYPTCQKCIHGHQLLHARTKFSSEKHRMRIESLQVSQIFTEHKSHDRWPMHFFYKILLSNWTIRCIERPSESWMTECFSVIESNFLRMYVNWYLNSLMRYWLVRWFQCVDLCVVTEVWAQ